MGNCNTKAEIPSPSEALRLKQESADKRNKKEDRKANKYIPKILRAMKYGDDHIYIRGYDYETSGVKVKVAKMLEDKGYKVTRSGDTVQWSVPQTLTLPKTRQAVEFPEDLAALAEKVFKDLNLDCKARNEDSVDIFKMFPRIQESVTKMLDEGNIDVQELEKQATDFITKNVDVLRAMHRD